MNTHAMSFNFTLPYMPTTTSQQKGYNRRSGHFYEKSSVRYARTLYEANLAPFRPSCSLVGPLVVSIHFVFDVKNPRQWGQPKSSRPDVDNVAKLFLDCMTSVGFWSDDAQIVDLRLVKSYGEIAAVSVDISPFVGPPQEHATRSGSSVIDPNHF